VISCGDAFDTVILQLRWWRHTANSLLVIECGFDGIFGWKL